MRTLNIQIKLKTDEKLVLSIKGKKKQQVKKEIALNQIINTEHRLDTKARGVLDCKNSNLLARLGYKFIPSDTAMLKMCSMIWTITRLAI